MSGERRYSQVQNGGNKPDVCGRAPLVRRVANSLA